MSGADSASLSGRGSQLLKGLWGRCGGWEFNRVRLSMGWFLTLGLEFQLAGDILRTAVAPTFTEIGQLAVVAVIRTALNFFLSKEIEKERKEVERV